MQKHFDIIIVGAGASGLLAAWDLCIAGKKIVMLEAKERVGGRIYGLDTEPHVELGAEFVHGDLPLTKMLLKKAGAGIYEQTGKFLRKENNKWVDGELIEDYELLNKKFKELTHDISIFEFFNEYLNEPEHEDLRTSLQTYVEGYYAANINFTSTFALRDELQHDSEMQYGITGGYQQLVDYLHQQLLKNGCTIILNSPVSKIEWKNNFVSISHKNEIITADKILITVSLGVLQSGNIVFQPALTEKINTALQLGFGHAIKLVMEFQQPFWRGHAALHHMSFAFADEIINTWWTAYPKKNNLITGWLAGPKAEQLKDVPESELVSKALYSLSNIFDVDLKQLESLLVKSYTYNWMNDPFTLGAYSYDTINDTANKQLLKQPIDNTIFFAGEALHEGPETGTVEAALTTGRAAAQQILSI
jgi:monoamine oxidase